MGALDIDIWRSTSIEPKDYYTTTHQTHFHVKRRLAQASHDIFYAAHLLFYLISFSFMFMYDRGYTNEKSGTQIFKVLRFSNWMGVVHACRMKVTSENRLTCFKRKHLDFGDFLTFLFLLIKYIPLLNISRWYPPHSDPLYKKDKLRGPMQVLLLYQEKIV